MQLDLDAKHILLNNYTLKSGLLKICSKYTVHSLTLVK